MRGSLFNFFSMSKPCALITGITGQDGSYLAELLLNKGYTVHGIKRRTSLINTDRIDHLYHDRHERGYDFYLHHGDMTDSSSLIHILRRTRPDEVYNLAAQSHVAVSFEEPEYTADSDALGALRLLEAIRTLDTECKIRYYQASTSELYGKVPDAIQSESTSFVPRSPYAAAKVYAFWIAAIYRQAYGIFAANGILFNHESPRRGETFVTRKITLGLARVKLGLQACLYVGNLNAKRDWGHARDFVEAMWLILQQDEADDFIVATGVQYSVRQFADAVAQRLDMALEWHGEGTDEHAIDQKTGKVVIRVDERFFRPAEVESLCGDASKARAQLGWQPRTSFDMLVDEMAEADLALARQEQARHG